jgi:tRNA (guanine-N7-)-methyltransferase
LNTTDSNLEAPNLKAAPGHLARVAARVTALADTLKSTFPPDISSFTLEIGSGHGHFLVKYAALNPNRFHIGIDLLSDRLRKAERKVVAAGIRNVRFLKAEAEEFLGRLPAGMQIFEVLILFPDPWPKKRHHKNRLIQPLFLSHLANRTSSGGRMFFRTDHEPYLAWAREKIGAHPCWRIIPDAPWAMEEQTVFQKRASSFGSLVAEVRTPAPIETPTG